MKMSSLAVYVFFNHLYVDQQKNYPKVIILATLFHCQLNLWRIKGHPQWPGLKPVSLQSSVSLVSSYLCRLTSW